MVNMYITPHPSLFSMSHQFNGFFPPMFTNMLQLSTFLHNSNAHTWTCMYMYVYVYCTHILCGSGGGQGEGKTPASQMVSVTRKETFPQILQFTNFQCKHQQ